MSRRRRPRTSRRPAAETAPAVTVAYGATLRRAAPGLALLAVVGAAAAWAAAGRWSAFAVVAFCLVDAAADGWFARRRALAALAAGGAGGEEARLVTEFVRTYLWVVATMALTAYLALTGALLLPRGAAAPPAVWGAFRTWPFWSLALLAVATRGFLHWWDHVRGGEAVRLPAATAVSEPLRRLFVLQFGVLAGAVLIYWLGGPSARWLAVLLALKAVADVVLHLLERLRAARVAAAVAAGLPPRSRRAPRRRRGRR